MLVLATPTNPGTASFTPTTALSGSLGQLGSLSGESVDSANGLTQTLLTIPIAAGLANLVSNTLRVRNVLRVQATDTVVTVAVTYKFGTFTLFTSAPVAPGSTGRVQMLDLFFRCVTPGATGRLDGSGLSSNSVFGAPPSAVNVVIPQPFVSPIDLTAALDFSVSITFSAITGSGLNVIWNEGAVVDLGVA
jgi:hypothetical protein